jgi:hypothetical protein
LGLGVIHEAVPRVVFVTSGVRMIPAKTDPRWRALVTGNTNYELKGLATRMMLTRVRLMGSRKDEKSQKEAIDTAYDFFTKNLEAARDDIRAIFG